MFASVWFGRSGPLRMAGWPGMFGAGVRLVWPVPRGACCFGVGWSGRLRSGWLVGLVGRGVGWFGWLRSGRLARAWFSSVWVRLGWPRSAWGGGSCSLRWVGWSGSASAGRRACAGVGFGWSGSLRSLSRPLEGGVFQAARCWRMAGFSGCLCCSVGRFAAGLRGSLGRCIDLAADHPLLGHSGSRRPADEVSRPLVRRRGRGRGRGW